MIYFLFIIVVLVYASIEKKIKGLEDRLTRIEERLEDLCEMLEGDDLV